MSDRQLSPDWQPDFLIIGTQKGGTNSLYNYLVQHPQIAPALQYKEVHFFDLHFGQGLDWYRHQFPDLPQNDNQNEKILLGEATPYYLFHPLVPIRVHQLFPQIKLIVLLRNPVDRAISHYYWEVKLGYEKLDLKEAIDQEAERLQGEAAKILADPTYYSFNHQHYSYLSRGLYAEQLQRWFDYFSPSQILIIPSEDFFTKPDIIFDRVLQFLGLSPYQLPEYKQYNPGNYSPINDPIIYQKLADYFTPFNQQLASLVNRDFTWENLNTSLLPTRIEAQKIELNQQKRGMIMTNEKAKIDYEGAWDEYAKDWRDINPNLKHIGDEWIGKAAGATDSLADYENLIESTFIKPYIQSHHTVLEIGIGGGKTGNLLLKYAERLFCADISQQMLQATEKRLGTERVTYFKLNGISLNNIPDRSADVCFCYDTMVHIEARDIFNYLSQIPRILKGDRLCLFHHANIFTDLGWQKFLHDLPHNLMGQRHGTAFSVMTDTIMEKFLTTLNYQIIHKETQAIPRDCVWICQAPDLANSSQI